MSKTLKSTLVILLCAVGLTACNANNPHHVSTSTALVVGVGIGSLLHGHGHYKHSHRNSRGHSHGRPHNSQWIKPVKYGHNPRPHKGQGPRGNNRPPRPYYNGY